MGLDISHRRQVLDVSFIKHRSRTYLQYFLFHLTYTLLYFMCPTHWKCASSRKSMGETEHPKHTTYFCRCGKSVLLTAHCVTKNYKVGGR